MNCAIIGAGTYGEVYAAYLEEAGHKVVSFFDTNKELVGTKIQGIPVAGSEDLLLQEKYKQQIEGVFCPIGNNSIRRKVLTKVRQMGYQTPNFIHHSAIINETVTIGQGCYFLPGVIVMPHTVIKDFTMISMGAKVAHHSVLETGVFLSTGVNFGANIVADQDAYVGIGATIMTGVKRLGKRCLVGSGAVVIRDVEDDSVVAGVPAKVIKYK